MRAIISVSDKTGLGAIARGLQGLGAEVYSTGGTRAALEAAGVSVHGISELTNFPEILEGRVKTLHPAVHAGLLARRDRAEDLATLAEHSIQPIDAVVVNLYPFSQTVARTGVALAEALENIDIGGPTLVRAAAKNFPAVVVLVDPEDYEPVLSEWQREGAVGSVTRRRLAAKAFQHVSTYDSAIAAYLREGDLLPDHLTLALDQVSGLRYGENPHQAAALYRYAAVAAEDFVFHPGRVLQGKELSYNNILDADAALRAAADFPGPTVAIIKHANPCGLASSESLALAYEYALAGDPVSAYGGIVGFNRVMGAEVAEMIASTFYEVVIGPDYTAEALDLLAQKKNLRVIRTAGADIAPRRVEPRPVVGGVLLQAPDLATEAEAAGTVVTSRPPTEQESRDLWFAWRAVKHVKSNGIMLAHQEAITGMGAGQPSRVDSVEIAIRKAGERASGSVMASDAYFPFPDGVERAAEAGVTAVIQPGGSVRDAEAIAAANRFGLAMVFTGVRHFRH